MVEPGDTLVVSNGEHEEAATVEETETYRGTELANVTSDSFDGWVEVPENPADPRYRLVCRECGRKDEEDEHGNRPWVKDHTVNHRGSAETLAQIHRVQSNGHEASIEVTA